jgi:hypothetical protein
LLTGADLDLPIYDPNSTERPKVGNLLAAVRAADGILMRRRDIMGWHPQIHHQATDECDGGFRKRAPRAQSATVKSSFIARASRANRRRFNAA